MTWLHFCNGMAQILKPLSWCILFGGLWIVVFKAHRDIHSQSVDAMFWEMGQTCETCELMHSQEEVEDGQEEQPETEED